MLDLKFLRTHFEEVKQKLQHRGEDLADSNDSSSSIVVVGNSLHRRRN